MSYLKAITLVIVMTLSITGHAQLSASLENGILNATAGDTLHAKVLITNTSSEDIHTKLTLKDITTNVNGSKYLDIQDTQNPRTNLSWITLSNKTTIIPAKQQVEVPIEISVPNDLSLEGSYWGIIMVEGEPKLVADYDPEIPNSHAIQILSRHALNVIVNIGQGTAKLAFENPQLINDGDSRTLFQVDVLNTGTRVMTPVNYLELYTLEGEFTGRIDTDIGRLRPDNPQRILFNFSKTYISDNDGQPQHQEVLAGTYNAILVSDAGGDDIFGVRYTLELETAN